MLHRAPRARRLVLRRATPGQELELIRDVAEWRRIHRGNSPSLLLPVDSRLMYMLRRERRCRTPSAALLRVFTRRHYRPAHYNAGVRRLARLRREFYDFLDYAERHLKPRGFVIPSRYCVIVTRFGPGGAFDPVSGRIWARSTANGQFADVDPLHVLIHEAVHIGIARIARGARLNYEETERVVDLLSSAAVGTAGARYKMQTVGERLIDPYVRTGDLRVGAALYVRHYPRPD